jgi:hypothetical protein
MKKFPFGLDRERIVRDIAAIHNGLANGDVIPQAVSYDEQQGHDDFTIRTITLKFAIAKTDEQEG